MVKYFCDRCGKETEDNLVAHRLHTDIQNPKRGTIKIEIMLGVNGMMNEGVICRECLLEILKELK